MVVTVLIPAPLRRLTQGKAEVEIDGVSVRSLLDALEDQYPGLGDKIRNPEGSIRRYINLYVNGDEIRFLEGMDTILEDGDRISIVPAIAGGTGIQNGSGDGENMR